ncbi:MAG TPA: lanthionine synthetase LanC family protein [Thermoanaerobaculia bacterium]|nr:lanthionine synthetase LanC family protein [Thermoanaerobaculia bacterium]
MGGDLYDGTAGIAVFLAALYAATGETLFRETARGALEHALALAHEGRCRSAGLYTGRAGIAWAAVALADVLGDISLIDLGVKLALRDAAADEGDDVMSGRAGIVMALVALWRRLGNPAVIERAVRLGDALLRNAVRDGETWSWRMSRQQETPPLTGFSHGAAGVACALAELLDVTREERFRPAIAGAAAYERQWFDAECANWRDLREGGSFSVAWCHGAPGIALSRLRMMELLGGDAFRQEADIAVQTTSAAFAADAADWSVCHGAAGLAEVLLRASAVLRRPGLALRVRDIAAEAAVRFGKERPAWPSGARHGHTPGHFLGLAGIGHMLVRSRRAEAPPPLLLIH